MVSTVPQGTGRESKVSLTINGVRKDIASAAFSGSPEVLLGLTAEIAAAGLGQPEDFAKVKMAGKIALIQRGVIKFTDKVKNAIAAEAVGVIVYNNEPGVVAGAVTADGTTVAIPVVGIDQSVGQDLVSKLSTGSAQASIQTSRSNYEAYDGTSMATPHVAGVSALVKAANKNLKGADVKSILRSTATALQGPNDQNQVGAGLVNAAAAVAKALGQ